MSLEVKLKNASLHGTAVPVENLKMFNLRMRPTALINELVIISRVTSPFHGLPQTANFTQKPWKRPK